MLNLPPGVTATEHTTREAWLEDRKGSTGASAVASLFDVGWHTKLQAYAMATGVMAPPEETEAMRMGHIMEPVIRDLFEEETGYKTQDWGEFTILRNEQFPGQHVTLDFPIMAANGKRKAPAVLECKNVGHYMAAKDWENGELPLYVQMQVQAQLAITGWEWGAVGAILGGNKFVFDFVERNEDFIKELSSRVALFWANVKSGTPPEPTADDADAILALFPSQVEGKTVELPEHFDAVCEQLAADKLEVKRLSPCISFAENRIKGAMGDAEQARTASGISYSYKRQVRKAHTVKGSETRVLRRLKS